MDNEKDNYKLWCIRKTLMKMIHKKGYEVEKDDLDQTLEQFKIQFVKHNDRNVSVRSCLSTIHRPRFNKAVKPLITFFLDEPKIGTKTIKKYHQRMEKDHQRAIIVVKEGLTSLAKQYLISLERHVLKVFLESELNLDISGFRHDFEHIVLTADEKEKLLTRYKLEKNQLMRIDPCNPVIRDSDVKRGQVVKIIETMWNKDEKYVSYKLVW